MKWLKAGLLIIAFAALLGNSYLVAEAQPVNVNDFRFSRFEADYYLSRDDQGRSRLKVVERFTADFPVTDQNKGIVRSLPNKYDGHPLSLEIDSLERNGQKEPIYDQQTSGDTLMVSTGTDEYLRGSQDYTLTYTLRDVIKDFNDHQEFYWDTNGTESTQAFGSVVARVHLDSSVRPLFTGKLACYEGRQGSASTCGSVEIKGSQVTFRSAGEMAGFENVTMVMEFKKGAFSPYSEGALGLLRYGLAIFSVVSIIGAVVWAIVLRLTKGKKEPGRGTVVPEYLPPKEESVLFAGQFKGNQLRALPALFIDLAVRHKLRIIETETKGLFGKSKQYSLELITAEGIRNDEREVLAALFPDAKPGSMYEVNGKDIKTGKKLQLLVASATKRITSEGYRRKVKGIFWPLIPAFIGGATGMGVLIWIMAIDQVDWTLGAVAIAFTGFVATLIIVTTTRPYQKG